MTRTSHDPTDSRNERAEWTPRPGASRQYDFNGTKVEVAS